MRKLISISVVIALLVTFLVPVAAGAAEQNCTECGPLNPCPVDVPEDCAGTDTMGGAVLWTLLGTSYIMGRAVGDTTEHIAGTLGCYVDELAVPVFGVIAVLADGIGGLLEGLGDMLGMEGIFGPLADMLTGLAEALENALPT